LHLLCKHVLPTSIDLSLAIISCTNLACYNRSCRTAAVCDMVIHRFSFLSRCFNTIHWLVHGPTLEQLQTLQPPLGGTHYRTSDSVVSPIDCPSQNAFVLSWPITDSHQPIIGSDSRLYTQSITNSKVHMLSDITLHWWFYSRPWPGSSSVGTIYVADGATPSCSCASSPRLVSS
jgi:hypothetical protein